MTRRTHLMSMQHFLARFHRPVGRLLCAAALGGAACSAAVHAAPPRGLDVDFHSGVVSAVDPARQVLQVNGQTLQWDAERLRVLHEVTGKPLPLSRLRSGTRVRYTLEARPSGPSTGATTGARAALRVVTVYVQEQP